MHRSGMCLAEKYSQLVSHYIFHFFKQREENVGTAILQGLKTKQTFNVIHVERFFAWFPATDLETVLQMSIPKFKDNKYFLCCCSFTSSLIFTLGFYASISFIWFRNGLMKIKNFKNLSNTSS